MSKIVGKIKLRNLMMRSSKSSPYTGKLAKKDNIVAALELVKLVKGFADKGQTSEAMNVSSKKWGEVRSEIIKLK